MGPTSEASRRERTRAATVEEIKQTALTLMREAGTVDVRFTDIARSMGLTAPALYRYFADRDELLTELVADSFNALSSALAAVRDTVPADDLGGRLLAMCSAYRSWALGNPQRFALIFGMPVPGYAAPPDGPTVAAGQRAMARLTELVLDAQRLGLLGNPQVAPASSQFVESASEQLAPFRGAVSPETYQALMLSWAAVHGFVSLEANGQFGWMDEPTREGLFAAQVRAAATVAGLVPPPLVG